MSSYLEGCVRNLLSDYDVQSPKASEMTHVTTSDSTRDQWLNVSFEFVGPINN